MLVSRPKGTSSGTRIGPFRSLRTSAEPRSWCTVAAPGARHAQNGTWRPLGVLAPRPMPQAARAPTRTRGSPLARGSVRVLVGIESAQRLSRRVELALAEAERVGAFSRGTVCLTLIPLGPRTYVNLYSSS